MAFQLKCAEAGSPCKFEVKTESKDEIFKHVQIHMEAAHPEMVKNPPPPDVINKLIHQV